MDLGAFSPTGVFSTFQRAIRGDDEYDSGMARKEPGKKKAGKRTIPAGMAEFAVDRETLMRFFRPPVSDSTFYKLLKDGYIVPVEAVSGRYRLNLSLVRMGLAPVSEPPGDLEEGKRERIVRLGLWMLAPKFAECPSWLLLREPTDEELERAALFALSCLPKFKTLQSDRDRKEFVQGAVDAIFLKEQGIEICDLADA